MVALLHREGPSWALLRPRVSAPVAPAATPAPAAPAALVAPAAPAALVPSGPPLQLWRSNREAASAMTPRRPLAAPVTLRTACYPVAVYRRGQRIQHPSSSARYGRAQKRGPAAPASPRHKAIAVCQLHQRKVYSRLLAPLSSPDLAQHRGARYARQKQMRARVGQSTNPASQPSRLPTAQRCLRIA